MASPEQLQAPRPPYSFSLGSLSELDDYATVGVAAFAGSVFDSLYPGFASNPEGYFAFRKEKDPEEFKDPNVLWGKVMRTDTGEVVAIGKWEICDGGHKKDSRSQDKEMWEGANKELLNQFTCMLRKHHEENMADKPHYSKHITHQAFLFSII
jgi:hypothetical protein